MGLKRFTLDEVRNLCPPCSEKMERMGLKEVELEEDYFVSKFEEVIKKFQDDRPPKAWWNRCISSVKRQEGIKDPEGLCGYIWYHLKKHDEGEPTIPETKEDAREALEAMRKLMSEDEDGSYNIDNVEIFKAGIWNGDKYTQKDLQKLVDNFEALEGKVKPPIKLGHPEDQKLLNDEGLPAAGWVTKLKVMGDKLVASFKDIPKKIYDIVKRRGYKRVSSEIYPKYTDSDTGKSFGPVLRAVAFLGGDIPAVDSLEDVSALYNESDQLTKCYVLSMEEEPMIKEFIVKGAGMRRPRPDVVTIPKKKLTFEIKINKKGGE